MAEKVWFITGVSSGFGRMLAEEVARSGDKVIGTMRQASQLQEFNNLVPGNTFGYLLDVTNPDGVKATTDAAFEHFGRIDVLVNNAGFGFLGAVEETSVKEFRNVMETNFFGALQVTQALLPYMRKQVRGHIVQMSSVAGFRASQGFGAYNASKFALEGFSEALAKEAAPFNIRVTLVEPGPFRTNFAGASIKKAADKIEAYAATAGAFQHYIETGNGQQEGDPVKAAKVIIEAVNAANPPLRLPLGTYAFDAIGAKLAQVAQDLQAWEATATKTSFDN